MKTSPATDRIILQAIVFLGSPAVLTAWLFAWQFNIG